MSIAKNSASYHVKSFKISLLFQRTNFALGTCLHGDSGQAWLSPVVARQELRWKIIISTNTSSLCASSAVESAPFMSSCSVLWAAVAQHMNESWGNLNYLTRGPEFTAKMTAGFRKKSRIMVIFLPADITETSTFFQVETDLPGLAAEGWTKGFTHTFLI